MPTGYTRLTLVVTKEMETRLANAKRNLFYDCTQSDMIRELVLAGLKTLDEEAAKEKQSAQAK